MKLILFLVVMLALNQYVLAQGGYKDTVWMRWTTDIYKVRFSPDDSKIIAVCSGGLRIFDTQTGNELKKIENVWYAEIDSVRNRLIVSWQNKFEIYDLNTFEKVSDFYDPGTPVYFPSFSSKNNRVVGQKEGGFTFKVWDCNTGKEIFSKTYDTLINPASGRKSLGYLNHQYYNDGKNVLGVEIDYIDYHDGDPKKMPYVFKRVFEVYDATTMQIISDNSLLCNQYVSGSGNYSAYIGGDAQNPLLIVKSIMDSEEILSIPIISLNDITDMAFSQNDKYFAYVPHSKGRINLVDMITRKEIKYFNVGTYYNLAISKNNKYIQGTIGDLLILHKTGMELFIESDTCISKTTITYPNPNYYGHLNLEFDLLIPNQTLITVVDVFGNNVHLVQNKYLDIGHYNYSINLNDLANGEYNLKIESGKSYQIIPFVLNK